MRITKRSAQLLSLGVLSASSAVAAPADDALTQEMIVTATRLQQPLLDHPGSITRVAAQDIELRSATHHSDLMNRAPGTLIQRGSGQESLTAIRSPVLSGAGSCGAFLILEDGLPIRPNGFCNVNDLFEVNSEQADAVEILRGPGSALYGSNSMHGTVNVLFDSPEAHEGVRTSIEGGSDDYLRLRGAVSVPGEGPGSTGWRAMGHWTHDGGFRADSGFEEAKLNAQLEHRFDADKLDVRLAATNLNQETAGFIQGFEAYKNPALRRSNANPEAFRDARSTRVTTHWEHALSESQRLDVRGAVRSSRMDFLQHFLLGKPLEENGQDSASLYVTATAGSEESRWTWGADAEMSTSFLIEDQDGPTTDGAPAANAIRPAGKHYDYEVDTWSAAAYVQFERELVRRLTLTLGLRAERVNYDYDNRMLDGNTDENGVACAFGGCLFNRLADRSDAFTNLAPKVALLWHVSDTQRLFVNLARGFRAPETSELYRLQRLQSVADLDSERIDSIELGLRGSAGAFSYSLVAFALDKRNVILRDANAFNVSDGRTSHRGFEYEISWSPLQQLRFSAAGTLARHRYEFDRSAEQGEQIRDGNDVDTAPRQVHAVRAQWQPRPSLRTELEWLSVGHYFVDAANANRYPGHELLNTSVSWQFVPGWHVAARVNNVLDRAYADRADFAFGNYRYFPGRDRTAFVEIGYASH